MWFFMVVVVVDEQGQGDRVWVIYSLVGSS